MNKQQLITQAANNADLTQVDTGKALEAILEVIMNTVANGDKVSLIGFGSFEPATRKARTARNPATGETVEVPEKVVPKFKPGREFKAQVGGS
jgi:DNA-binding protein HU-beta